MIRKIPNKKDHGTKIWWSNRRENIRIDKDTKTQIPVFD